MRVGKPTVMNRDELVAIPEVYPSYLHLQHQLTNSKLFATRRARDRDSLSKVFLGEWLLKESQS